jgi:hypothetical protein
MRCNGICSKNKIPKGEVIMSEKKLNQNSKSASYEVAFCEKCGAKIERENDVKATEISQNTVHNNV